MTDNVVSLVDKALKRATVRFALASAESPPLFSTYETPLSDAVTFTAYKAASVLGVRVVVPGTFEAQWSPPPGEERTFPYPLKRGEVFRLNGIRSAIAKQMPALLAEKSVLAQSRETR